jgi:4-hydroxy-2-oxoheptanedioate aldolase
MSANPLKVKLQAGQPVFGVWSILNAPAVTEIFATAGLDFQILDMEHGVYDLASLDAGVRACEGAGCAPLVRVPSVNPSAIQSCLDMGAYGVVVPQVTGEEEARRAIEASKFPPLGTRGFNPFTRAGNYGADIGGPSRKFDNGFGLTMVIIENLAAFQELDRILAIPDLDVIYLGVYDMSAALGCMGDMAHPAVRDFVENATIRAVKAGKAVGVMACTPKDIEYYLGLGARFIVYGVDSHVIYKAVRDGLKSFQQVTQ